MDSISSTKKKKKSGSAKNKEPIQISFAVSKPGSKKYTHVDYQELLKNNGKKIDEEELRRFYDEDTLFMAKKLRETKSKSGKRIRVNLDELRHFNRNSGYDMDDDFIDDTEAVDDGIFTSQKGGFYAGKGEVKDVNQIDEEEEESEEEVVPEAPKPKKKQMKDKKQKPREKNGSNGKPETIESTSSSSDSEAEPVRMTGAPPTIRMGGAPPSKRFSNMKRQASPALKKDPTPPPAKIFEPVKKKPSPPAPQSSSSSNSDVVCLDDEPPAKKQKAPDVSVKKPLVVQMTAKAVPPTKPSTSEEIKTNGSTASSSSTKGSSVTMLAKKICKQQQEDVSKETTPTKPVKPVASTSSTSSSPNDKSLTAQITKLFEKLVTRGKEFKEKKLKTFDEETIKEILEFMDLMKSHKTDKTLMETLVTSLSNSFGMTSGEVVKEIERGITATPKKNSIDWKLTEADLPFMKEQDIKNITTIVQSWRNKKELSNATLTAWLKEVNQARMTADQARKRFYELVQSLPEIEKQPDVAVELPKHERSRKARMFLHQWVYLSRLHIQQILPKLKKPLSTEGFAKKQINTINVMKDQLKKQIALYEGRKERLMEDATFTFAFSEPVLAAMVPYLEELCDYSLSIKNLYIVVTGIDALHHAVHDNITQVQFYIELCRRVQKFSFLLVEEPMKSRLKAAEEVIVRYQVVQNPKYQIKWPSGEEPSLRGLTRELHEYDKSVLWKPPRLSATTSTASTTLTSTPLAVRASTNTTPSTSSATKLPSTTVEVTANDIQGMNHVTQVDQNTKGSGMLRIFGKVVSKSPEPQRMTGKRPF